MKKILHIVKENYRDTDRFFPGSTGHDQQIQQYFLLIQDGNILPPEGLCELSRLDSIPKDTVSHEVHPIPSISYQDFLEKIFEVDLVFVV